MAEVLIEFDALVVGDDGEKYDARACGGPMPDGLWEGWIEFIPLDGGTPLRSPRETTQPDRSDAVYWASGLTPVYLAGALGRALDAITPRASPEPMRSAQFATPAAGRSEIGVRPGRAILDPYAAYEKGEILLRQELNAISNMHLVNIIREYGLSDEPDAVLGQLSSETLAEIIVSAVRRAPAR